MFEKIKPHLFTIAIIIFALFNILKPDKPSEFKRWAYIARDENASQWERVIAHMDSQMVPVSPDDEERCYYVYAIEYPDSGKICDADAQCWELENDRALSLTIFSSYNDTSSDYYIRLTGEEVK